MAADPIRAPLLSWYRRERRDLPWRRTKDPYAIWVSEVMLQQTTVSAVIPYWERFLERFPSVKRLASAREDDVLAAWSGLGYYRRARALREGAIAVVARHGGRVPDDLEQLRALPGIGRYTAGAIASVAFDRKAAVVDGNVKRVFSRLYAIRGKSGAALEKRYWSIAETLVAAASPGAWNQAVMELGATICTPRDPRCPVCPIARWCRARELGRPASFPARTARPKPRSVRVAALWIARRGRVLLERRHPDGALRGAWDLPAAVVPAGAAPGGAITRVLMKRHGLAARSGRILVSAKHAILATRLAIDVFEGTTEGTFPRSVSLRWIAFDRLSEMPISGATAKIARAVLAQGRPSGVSSSPSSSSGSRVRLNA